MNFRRMSRILYTTLRLAGRCQVSIMHQSRDRRTMITAKRTERGKGGSMSSLNRSRWLVGLVLMAAAIVLLMFGSSGYSTAGIIALAVLGLISIAISRRR